jgi:hypothetical protein
MTPPKIIVADPTTLRESLADLIRNVMIEHVPAAIAEATKPNWFHRDAVKERYGLTDRQLQYLRDNEKVTYSQRGRRIWYLRQSVEDYFEGGRVEASDR